MDYFIDICLVPDPEFSSPTLMNVLFNKLHKNLVVINSTDIGVSFPEYSMEKKVLGNKLRVHGEASRLDQLSGMPWLTGLRDYIFCGEISQIPEKTTPAHVQRVQVKSNVERVRRRHMKRHNLNEGEVKIKIPLAVEKRLNLPYLIVNSESTQQKFRLFVRQEKVAEHYSGQFNTYGLSKGATVHLF